METLNGKLSRFCDRTETTGSANDRDFVIMSVLSLLDDFYDEMSACGRDMSEIDDMIRTLMEQTCNI